MNSYRNDFIINHRLCLIDEVPHRDCGNSTANGQVWNQLRKVLSNKLAYNEKVLRAIQSRFSR